mgnify:CR=1 FL=1
MTTCFLFDVDGTLTEARQPMEEEFASFFESWATDKNVYLVSGSDLQKIQEQVPSKVLNKCKGIFSCMGNELWQEDKNNNLNWVYKNKLTLPQEIKSWLDQKIKDSKFENRPSTRKPPHFEFRAGMVNFSVVGRGASTALRQYYYDWDEGQRERETIAKEFNELFKESHNLEALVGGQISLDIQQVGKDKGQVLDHLDFEKYIFFGDRCFEGGNDYSISVKVDEVCQVTDYKHTRKLLESYEFFEAS